MANITNTEEAPILEIILVLQSSKNILQAEIQIKKQGNNIIITEILASSSNLFEMINSRMEIIATIVVATKGVALEVKSFSIGNPNW